MTSIQCPCCGMVCRDVESLGYHWDSKHYHTAIVYANGQSDGYWDDVRCACGAQVPYAKLGQHVLEHGRECLCLAMLGQDPRVRPLRESVVGLIT